MANLALVFLSRQSNIFSWSDSFKVSYCYHSHTLNVSKNVPVWKWHQMPGFFSPVYSGTNWYDRDSTSCLTVCMIATSTLHVHVYSVLYTFQTNKLRANNLILHVSWISLIVIFQSLQNKSSIKLCQLNYQYKSIFNFMDSYKVLN